MVLLKSIKKAQLITCLLLMIISSFNGVVISQIIVQASDLGNKANKVDILKFAIESLVAWNIIYGANYLFEISKSSIIKYLNINLKKDFFEFQYSNSKKIKNYSEIISRIANDMKIIETNLFEQFFIIISNSTMFFISFVYMLHLNATIALIFIFFALLPMLVAKIMGKKLTLATNKWSLSNIMYTKTLKELFGGHVVLKNYGLQSIVYIKHERDLLEVENNNLNLKVVESKAKLFSAAMSGFCFIIPFAIGCYIASYDKNISIGILVGIFLANDRVIGPMQTIVASLNKVNMTRDLWNEISNSINKEFISNSYLIEYDTLEKSDIIDRICLNNVVYKINTNNILSFDNEFKCPFKILLIGKSGSGKTTIFNLIKGRLPMDNGEILFKNPFGTIIKDGNRLVSYVSQSPYIFDSTLEDNVTLFQKEMFDNNDIYGILKKMKLDIELNCETKQELMSYECGDAGRNLSGGQKQKIEIARALIRGQKIFLLDEITANLDKENSKRVHDLLFDLDISFIEIAHHFEINDSRYTLIYELNNGKIKKLR